MKTNTYRIKGNKGAIIEGLAHEHFEIISEFHPVYLEGRAEVSAPIIVRMKLRGQEGMYERILMPVYDDGLAHIELYPSGTPAISPYNLTDAWYFGKGVQKNYITFSTDIEIVDIYYTSAYTPLQEDNQ